MTDSAYAPGRRFAERSLARMGVETTFLRSRSSAPASKELMRPNTRVVYLESPGSHTFEVQDFPAIAKVAHAHGAAVIHDNAWATGIFFRSFDHGADLVVQPRRSTRRATRMCSSARSSRTRSTGRSCATFRATRDRRRAPTTSSSRCAACARSRRGFGQHEKSALEIAKKLEAHPKVKRVLYPALESDPGHALWKRDYLGATGLFGVELVDCAPAKLAAFIESLECFALGYSWGGFDSLIVPQNISKARAVRPWTGGPLIRLQIGLEDPADLYQDLEHGLERL
jgi:cystathionine beta-lyase